MNFWFVQIGSVEKSTVAPDSITQCSIVGSFYGTVLEGLAFILFHSTCYTW